MKKRETSGGKKETGFQSSDRYNILVVIESFMEDYTSNEKRVARYILDHAQEAAQLSSNQLAVRAEVSPAAVVRYCQKIHIGSYKRLSYLLAQAPQEERMDRAAPLDLKKRRKPEQIISGIFSSYMEHFSKIRQMINEEEIMKAVHLIVEANRVSIAGIGASALAAQDMLFKLQRLGISSFFTYDFHLQQVNAHSLTADDALMAISYSGESASVIETARSAKKRGCPVISLTGDKMNSLSRISACRLHVPTLESVFREGAGISRIEQMVMIDILFALIISMDYTRYIKQITGSGNVR